MFQLEFSGIVKALEIGLGIAEIRDYIQECSVVPVPENIITMFHDWEVQSQGIRIRTVTLVEADDNFLLEEIKNYSGMKENILGDIGNAIEINPKKSIKVLRHI